VYDLSDDLSEMNDRGVKMDHSVEKVWIVGAEVGAVVGAVVGKEKCTFVFQPALEDSNTAF
jgi:hypothetical protein